MKSLLSLIIFVTTLGAEQSWAVIRYNYRTQLGAKVGEVTVARSNLFFTGRRGEQAGADRSMEVAFAIPYVQAKPISALIANKESYRKFCKYREFFGSGKPECDAALYGEVSAKFKSGAEIEKAERIFKTTAVKIEVFDGLMDTFVYDSVTRMDPVLDAKQCFYDLNSPLWTLRFSANNEFLDVPYGHAGFVVRTDYFNGAAKKLFPEARHILIKDQKQCLDELKKVQKIPTIYQFISKSDLGQ